MILLAIQVDKKDNEAFESLLKRFNREVVRSKVIVTARQQRFHEKEPNKNMQRKTAVRKAQIREERKKFYSQK